MWLRLLEMLQPWDLQVAKDQSVSSTLVQSHSAGNTAVTDGNSQLSVTYFVTRGKNLGPLPNPTVQSAVRSLQERLLGTVILRTRNVPSRGKHQKVKID